MKLLEILKKARDQGISLLDAENLLAFSLNLEKDKLYSQSDIFFDNFDEDHFQNLIERRLEGEPIAYIVGEKEFYGRKFFVNEKTLIPRPETEFFLDFLDFFKKEIKFSCLADIGTGSGAIGLSVAKIFPDADIICSDISLDALLVAKKNALNLNIENVLFLESDLLSGYEDIYPEVIVANLPYIGKKEFNYLEENVLRYEPEIALFAGDDGLLCYRKLFKQIEDKYSHKNNLTLLMGEYGLGQSDLLAELLIRHFSSFNIYLFKDLAGIERFFVVSANSVDIKLDNYNVRKITTS